MAQPMTTVPPAPADRFDLVMDDDVVIRMRHYPHPTGVRIYLSHGNGFATDGYFGFWGPMLDDFDLVVFDARDSGQSSVGPLAHHTYAQMSRDLERIWQGVTDRLGPRTSVGAFHSMSGRVAMKHAIEIGWRFDALVLFDPPSMPLAWHALHEPMRAFERKLEEWALGRRERFASPDEMIAEYAANRAHARWAEGGHALMGRATVRRDDASGDWVLACPREYEAAIYRAAPTLNLFPPYDRFDGPIKIVGADPEARGGWPSGAANRVLAETYGYPYECIPGTGHMLQMENPAACTAALISFIAELGLKR